MLVKKHLAIFSALGPRTFSSDQRRRLRAAALVRFFVAPRPSLRLWLSAKTVDYVALTPRFAPDFSTAMIHGFDCLKGIAVFATGTDWLDVEGLAARGVVVSRLPNYSTVSVAEHAMALLLSMSRRIHLSFDRARHFVPAGVSVRGWELNGKSLGIVGFGRVGRAVASRAKAFGMKVLVTEIDSRRRPCTAMPLRRMLMNVHAVVLAASHARGSPPILGASELIKVRRGLYVINVGRSALVDNDAMSRAIRSGRIGGYAVDDVLPVFHGDPRLEPGRVLETGHTGWYSTEALGRGIEQWVRNMTAMARGKPIHLANSRG